MNNKKIINWLVIWISSFLITSPLLANFDIEYIDSKKQNIYETNKNTFNDYYIKFKKEFHKDLERWDFSKLEEKLKQYKEDIRFLESNKDSEYYKNLNAYKMKVQILENLKNEYNHFNKIRNQDDIYNYLTDYQKQLIKELRWERMFIGWSKYFDMAKWEYDFDLLEKDIEEFRKILNKNLSIPLNMQISKKIERLENTLLNKKDYNNIQEKEYIEKKYNENKKNINKINKEEYKKDISEDNLKPIKEINIIKETQENFNKNILKYKEKYKKEFNNRIGNNIKKLTDEKLNEVFLLAKKIDDKYSEKYKNSNDEKSLKLLWKIKALVFLIEDEKNHRNIESDIDNLIKLIN